LRILRYPSITPDQFHGCIAAFVDSLAGELNAATIALRRLEGQAKGRAFAYEMTLDTHRYGALIVLDRWSSLVRAFGPHVQLPGGQSPIENAAQRVQSAETVIARANQVVDAGSDYSPEIVEACVMAFQAAQNAFTEERALAERNAKLGPMLSEDYKSARQIFLEDLAAR